MAKTMAKHSISEQARLRKFKKVKTPISPETNKPPICVKCESRISGDYCLCSIKQDGFYLHIECGELIGVEVV